MPCINVREGDGIVSVIALDDCGAPALGPNGLLCLSTISEITFEDQIEEGDEVTEKNFGGRKQYSDAGLDEITSISVGLTSLGIIPALDAALLNSTSKLDGAGKVGGFGRNDLSAGHNLAIEVLMKLDTDACSGSGQAPVAGWLFPLVKNWKPGGGTTLNGSDLVKPPYSGKGYQNPRIFGSGGNAAGPLSKWKNVHVAGTEWYTFYLFDGASVTLPTASCDPVPLAVGAS